MTPVISIKTPARICFFGDHQDYLGLPVIAGTINRFITLTATPNNSSHLKIELPDIGELKQIDLNALSPNIPKNDYFQSGIAILKREGIIPNQGYDIVLKGNIPINAGLSSSSAIVVSWMRFLTTAYGGERTFEDVTIGKWAYQAEVQYFKQPGGLMDQYTIALQGIVFIDTQTATYTRLRNTLGSLIVAESGIPKKTLQVLQTARTSAQDAVKQIKRQHSAFEIQKIVFSDYEKYRPLLPKKHHPFWYAAVYNYDLTLKAKKELLKEKPNLSALGKWMQAQQHILQDKIQNTPPKMRSMIDAAHKSGARGAKIVGSGGGGCMVAMTNEASKQQTIDAFLKAGAKKAYEVKLIS